MFDSILNPHFNCLSDVGNCLFLSLTLAYTARQTRTFNNPIAIFTRIHNHLSHAMLPLAIHPEL